MNSRSVFAIRDRQRSVFESVLSAGATTTNFREWKVLICDAASYEIINTLFSRSQLRKHGITLHTIIDNPRADVPDVPGLYIITPTLENIAWLSRDLSSKNAVYDRAAVCFTTAITRAMLTALAAQLSVPSPITAVHDLYANFVSLEHNFFSLNMKESYLRINSVDNSQSLLKFVQPVVSGLFSVLLTLGVVPIIRSQRGGAAEAVAAALDEKLRDNLKLFQKSSISSRALSFRRPLLLLLDRDFDHSAVLHHTWTYQALVHDCLDMHHNSVTVKLDKDENESDENKKTYNLDKESDLFWASYSASPFPKVAEAIETDLTKYRADVEDINRRTGITNGSTSPDSANPGVGTSQLAEAIVTLPELSRRKETIDVHTNLATALLNNINKRSLDAFFELERELMLEAHRPVPSMSAQEYKGTLLELLKGEKDSTTGVKRGEGTAADRLRLFLIYYAVFGRQLSEKDMAEFRGVLNSAGADTSAIAHIGKMKRYRHDLVTEPIPSARGAINAARLKGMMTSVVSRGYRSIANVAQNAKKLIVDQKQSCSVTRILEYFMSEQARGRVASEANDVLDGYLLFDPKVMPSSDSMLRYNSFSSTGNTSDTHMNAKQKMMRMLFSDAIVFTVGGGNYVEYDNCVEAIASVSTKASLKNVMYGTTEVVSPENFLEQLSMVSNQAR